MNDIEIRFNNELRRIEELGGSLKVYNESIFKDYQLTTNKLLDNIISELFERRRAWIIETIGNLFKLDDHVRSPNFTFADYQKLLKRKIQFNISSHGNSLINYRPALKCFKKTIEEYNYLIEEMNKIKKTSKLLNEPILSKFFEISKKYHLNLNDHNRSQFYRKKEFSAEVILLIENYTLELGKSSLHAEREKLISNWEVWNALKEVVKNEKNRLATKSLPVINKSLPEINKKLPALPKQKSKLKVFKSKLVKKINKVLHQKEKSNELIAQIEVKK